MAEARDGVAEANELERVFAALAHPSRRHILITLQARGGEVTAGEIARRFACAWPTTTRHLKVLTEAGLVAVEKRGRERYYRVEADHLRAVVGHWLAFFPPRTQGLPRQ